MKIAKRGISVSFCSDESRNVALSSVQWLTLMPYVFELGGTMLGLGVLGTIIVILVAVWLVRRV